ncbi:MAG TPA: hypothetical protein VKE98_06915 [Gemmataceae bacterium]|nr:hypothetical protein [Gemmataceae bacterium]
MIRFRLTWLLLLAVAAVLVLVNWQCWQPGVGGAVGGRPPGTQLERFFGWPATYQAELWRSDDEKLASRILKSAPFYYPGDEMALEYREFGIPALAIDLVFALVVLFAIAVIMECTLRKAWGLRPVALLVGAGLLLVILFFTGPAASVSL